MINDTSIDNDDIEIFEGIEEENRQDNDLWKIIVADDDIEVHRVTKLVLRDFKYEGKGLYIMSAFTEAEVKELVLKNPDTNVIFLDVIMDRDDSGLNVVRYIRDELKNRTIRIILRTGQPGQTPEEETIVNYDINDYKEKTEFTTKKMFTSLITALRAYRHIIELEHGKKGLEEIIASTSKIFRPHTSNDFFDILLKCMISIVSAGRNVKSENISGLIAINSINDEYKVVSCLGEFAGDENKSLGIVLGAHEIFDIKVAIDEPCYFCKNVVTVCFKTDMYQKILAYIKCEHNFSQMEQNLISVFYSNASVTLDNMGLLHEIENTQTEILYTLGGIAEARSKELGQHVIRVAEYAKIIALGYGLSVEESELIRQAAPMHDIGKIAIPDEILNKPGKLTFDEFEVMKTHTNLGYDLLKNSNRRMLNAASVIALRHHEKYNGTGYPDKLKGEDIHIYGRISAIADVFDALGCDRVYKKAWELDRILELFRQERGQHFDPVLVDILFENIDKILQVKKSLPD